MTIIFDLDGTLLNTIDDLGHACNHALAQTGYAQHPVKAYPAMVGNGISNLILRALPVEARTEDNVARVRRHFLPYYDAHCCDFTRPYNGVPELLLTLKGQGHRLAVASNKYQAAAERIVEHYFPGLFDVVFGEREGVPRKPHRQIVDDIRALLPGEAIYVGDSLVDRDTSMNAGVRFVACSWGVVPRQTLVEANIEQIVDKAEEIAEIVSLFETKDN